MVTKNSNWLYEQYGYNVTSQHGEDGVIEKMFRIIKPTNKFCVEFGAMDGITWSNTYNLIMNHDWRSVQIEMRGDFFKDLVKTYEHKPVVCINKTVLPENIETILTQNNVPQDLDFMSIDVDGLDYNIFEAMTNFRPKVIIIECNPEYRNGEFVISPPASLASIVSLAKNRGYELVAVTGVNAIFVQENFYHWFEIFDNVIENYKIWTESRQFEFGLKLQ